MILYPKAKINIGLRLLRKRPDGYHDLESIFHKINLTDILEFQASEDSGIELTITGILPPDPEENILAEVYKAVEEKLPVEGLKVHLHKQIPIGAGLGGGSSDAAYFLRGLNDFFKLGISKPDEQEILLSFGSDCPFFLEEGPRFVTGIGDQFEEVEIELETTYMVLINPGIHVSTAEAYGNCIPSGSSLPKSFNKESSGSFVNDFESSVVPKFPEIGHCKNILEEAGAYYTSMTGSGSTIFGLFDFRPDIDTQSYWTWTGVL